MVIVMDGASDIDGNQKTKQTILTLKKILKKLSVPLIIIALLVYGYPLSFSSMVRGDWHPAQMVPKVGKGETNDALSEFFPWECASDEYLKANPSISNNIVEITEYNAGRMGNRDLTIGRAAAWALFYNMNLRLPKEGFISGFVSTCTTMRNMNINMTEQAKLDVPNKLSEPSRFFWDNPYPLGAAQELERKFVPLMTNLTRLHTGTNSTHGMGMKCSNDAENSISIHIRSGDITKEEYDTEVGSFKPRWVNHNYGQPPLYYYLYALLRAESMFGMPFDAESANRNNTIQIYVFCEDLSNPVCKHFQTVSYLNPNVHIRCPEYSNTTFVDDLHTIMCSRQIIQSRTTMNHVFRASRANSFHVFTATLDRSLAIAKAAAPESISVHPSSECTLKQWMCSCKYAIQDDDKRKMYNDEIYNHWSDNPYERSLMQAKYSMIHSCRR